jgi:hypothetical protein
VVATKSASAASRRISLRIDGHASIPLKWPFGHFSPANSVTSYEPAFQGCLGSKGVPSSRIGWRG